MCIRTIQKGNKMANGFRLISLYVGDFGCLKKQVFNFCSDYVTTVVEDNDNKLQLKVEHNPVLPSNFFALNEGSEGDGCVCSVSAIVGQNGSGKTTLARLLCSLPVSYQDKPQWKIVLIYEKDEKVCAWASFKQVVVELVDGDDKKTKIQPSSDLPYKLIYFSPHFTTEQLGYYVNQTAAYSDVREEGDHVYNVSTTWLLQHPEGNSELVPRLNYSGVDPESIKTEIDSIFDVKCDESKMKDQLYDYLGKWKVQLCKYVESIVRQLRGSTQISVFNRDEKVRLYNFVAVYREKLKGGDSLRHFEISEPRGALVCVNTEGVLMAVDHLDENPLISDCINTVCAPVKNKLLGLVPKAFCAFMIQSIFDYSSPHIPDMDQEGKVLDVIKVFIRNKFKDTTPSLKDITDFLSKRLSNWTFNTNKNDAIAFFDCLAKIANSPAVKIVGSDLYYRFGEKNVPDELCELVRLHEKICGTQPILKFDVYPCMSSGEMSFLTLFSRLYHFVKEKVPDEENAVIFLDEVETTLHPEWQRRLVAYFVRFCEVFLPTRRFQLIFASHSPILLSDIPKGNAVFLKKEEVDNKDGQQDDQGEERHQKKKKEKQGWSIENTFSANIFDLYRESFFLKEGTIGEFAKGKVDQLLKKLNPPKPSTSNEEYQQKLQEIKDDHDDVLKVASLIGDPFLSRYIWRRLEELSDNADILEDEFTVSDETKEIIELRKKQDEEKKNKEAKKGGSEQ